MGSLVGEIITQYKENGSEAIGLFTVWLVIESLL